MTELDTIEDTLFVPMLGRIYASENFPGILRDEKALELRDRLPSDIRGRDTQTQYTLLSGAVRSANIDRRITDFLRRKSDGVVVQFGCGLETAFSRNDNGKTVWYGLDLPEVIDYRRTLIPETDRERLIAGDAFSLEWLDTVRGEFPDAPILITASGVFQYFTGEKVAGLMRGLMGHGDIEVLFDVFSSSAMKRVHKYMEQVGHADAAMYFAVDDSRKFVSDVGGTAELILDEKYYAHTDRKGLSPSTRITMWGSDLFGMVRMVQVGLR